MIKLVKRVEEANCVTHSGTMHADEVFATAFLELYLKDIRVFRTPKVDLSTVSENTLVYDIGNGKYDHHQLDAIKRDNGILYSSVGLLWREFGKDYLKKNDYINIEEMFEAIDKDLVEGIDAEDNGLFPKIDSIYKVKTLPNIIKIFNPSYDSYETEEEQFLKAVELAKMIWQEEIYYINGKVLADKKINELLEEVQEEDKYLFLKEYLPYEETLLNNPKANNLLFVAFPSNRGGYAIKTIPKSIDDHSARLSFPKEWAGLQGKELEEVSNIPGLIFCHSACFIVSCKTIESAYQVLEQLCK